MTDPALDEFLRPASPAIPLPPGFRTDISRETGSVSLLVDRHAPALLPSGAAVPCRLDGCQRVDAVLVEDGSLLVSDSIQNRVLRYPVPAAGAEGARPVEEHPVPPGARIVAMARRGDDFLLLDKEFSQIRVCGPGWQERGTAGSRLGYRMPGRGFPRLGFEFPEDLLFSGGTLWVSDSGNQRLVALDSTLREWREILLPIHPRHILLARGDWILVSGFDQSLMAISSRHGFISRWPASSHHLRLIDSKREDGTFLALDPSGKPAAYSWTAGPVSEWPISPGRMGLRFSILAERGDGAGAAKLLSEYPDSILAYFQHFSSPEYMSLARAALDTRIEGFNRRLQEYGQEILARASEYVSGFQPGKVVPDPEAAELERAAKRFLLERKIKLFRSTLRKFRQVADMARSQPTLHQEARQALSTRVESARERLAEADHRIQSALDSLSEPDLAAAIAGYYLASDELHILPDSPEAGPRLFHAWYLADLLGSFHSNLAELYRKRGDMERYKLFMERELSLFPDRAHLMVNYVNALIARNELDPALSILDRQANRDKENIHYLYSRVYRLRNEKEKAAQHLKRELELFPNRVELIPELLDLRAMTMEETDRFVKQILSASVPAIDTCLNVARLFLKRSQAEKAREYIERELAYFPENQSAWAMKLESELNCSSLDRKAIRYCLRHLSHDTPRVHMLRSQAFLSLEDAGSSWQELLGAFQFLEDPKIYSAHVGLFSVLDEITPDAVGMEALYKLLQVLKKAGSGNGIEVYLSFRKHVMGDHIFPDIPRFSDSEYLLNNPARQSARRHFLEVAHRQNCDGNEASAMEMLRTILSADPRDSSVLLEEFPANKVTLRLKKDYYFKVEPLVTLDLPPFWIQPSGEGGVWVSLETGNPECPYAFRLVGPSGERMAQFESRMVTSGFFHEYRGLLIVSTPEGFVEVEPSGNPTGNLWPCSLREVRQFERMDELGGILVAHMGEHALDVIGTEGKQQRLCQLQNLPERIDGIRPIMVTRFAIWEKTIHFLGWHADRIRRIRISGGALNEIVLPRLSAGDGWTGIHVSTEGMTLISFFSGLCWRLGLEGGVHYQAPIHGCAGNVRCEISHITDDFRKEAILAPDRRHKRIFRIITNPVPTRVHQNRTI